MAQSEREQQTMTKEKHLILQILGNIIAALIVVCLPFHTIALSVVFLFYDGFAIVMMIRRRQGRNKQCWNGDAAILFLMMVAVKCMIQITAYAPDDRRMLFISMQRWIGFLVALMISMVITKALVAEGKPSRQTWIVLCMAFAITGQLICFHDALLTRERETREFYVVDRYRSTRVFVPDWGYNLVLKDDEGVELSVGAEKRLYELVPNGYPCQLTIKRGIFGCRTIADPGLQVKNQVKQLLGDDK